jgi:hypothetical protein
MKKSNVKRLVVYLNNIGKNKDFHTTYTYKDVVDESEAIRVVWAMHLGPTDNTSDVLLKIKKVIFNNKPLTSFEKKI